MIFFFYNTDNCQLSQWSEWTTCDQFNSSRKRFRELTDVYSCGALCTDPLYEEMMCQNPMTRSNLFDLIFIAIYIYWDNSLFASYRII